MLEGCVAFFHLLSLVELIPPYQLLSKTKGGFLLLVTKDAYPSGACEHVRSLLSDLKESHTLTYHAVEVDMEGLVTYTVDEKSS